jgi:GAF domain-containing protein
MGTDDRLQAAVSAGLLGAEDSHRALLASIVEVARAIFGAKASSIMLFDEDAGELVFEAVAGEGADQLVGRRFPATVGIAGWVLTSRQPLIIEDVESDPRFSRDVAESTGYVPRGLMSVPLLSEDDALGVLSVLDRPERSKFSLRESDLLMMFANQAAIALELVRGARRASAALAGADGHAAAVARLARTLDAVEPERRGAGVALLDALDELLRERR